MKNITKGQKFFPLLIITATLIFSFCLSGFTFGPFEVNVNFDDGTKLGGDCFAYGITATVDETTLLGYSVELRPTGEDEENVILTIRMLAADGDEDSPSADCFAIQCVTADDSDDTYIGLRWSSMENDYTVDESIFSFYDGEYHYETSEDTSLFTSYLFGVICHFDILMGD